LPGPIGFLNKKRQFLTTYRADLREVSGTTNSEMEEFGLTSAVKDPVTLNRGFCRWRMPQGFFSISDRLKIPEGDNFDVLELGPWEAQPERRQKIENNGRILRSIRSRPRALIDKGEDMDFKFFSHLDGGSKICRTGICMSSACPRKIFK
jgi:hypothetical protein